MIVQLLERFRRPSRRVRLERAGMPAGRFGTIMMDPPWDTITWSGKMRVPHRKGADPYPTMTLEQLAELPIGDLAAPDCVLHMWVIDSHVDQAIELAGRWGFTFKTVGFIWVKVSKGTRRPAMGMGRWTRKEAEICLLFTRGFPGRISRGVRQVIIAPRREHSRKPDEQYDRIERLSGGPYLEVFARHQRPGWTAWGNQTDKFENAA